MPQFNSAYQTVRSLLETDLPATMIELNDALSDFSREYRELSQRLTYANQLNTGLIYSDMYTPIETPPETNSTISNVMPRGQQITLSLDRFVRNYATPADLVLIQQTVADFLASGNFIQAKARMNQYLHALKLFLPFLFNEDYFTDPVINDMVQSLWSGDDVSQALQSFSANQPESFPLRNISDSYFPSINGQPRALLNLTRDYLSDAINQGIIAANTSTLYTGYSFYNQLLQQLYFIRDFVVPQNISTPTSTASTTTGSMTTIEDSTETSTNSAASTASTSSAGTNSNQQTSSSASSTESAATTRADGTTSSSQLNDTPNSGNNQPSDHSQSASSADGISLSPERLALMLLGTAIVVLSVVGIVWCVRQRRHNRQGQYPIEAAGNEGMQQNALGQGGRPQNINDAPAFAAHRAPAFPVPANVLPRDFEEIEMQNLDNGAAQQANQLPAIVNDPIIQNVLRLLGVGIVANQANRANAKPTSSVALKTHSSGPNQKPLTDAAMHNYDLYRYTDSGQYTLRFNGSNYHADILYSQPETTALSTTVTSGNYELGDSFDPDSCRAITWYNQQAVVCDGEKFTFVYVPHEIAPHHHVANYLAQQGMNATAANVVMQPFSDIVGNAMLGQALVYLGKNMLVSLKQTIDGFWHKKEDNQLKPIYVSVSEANQELTTYSLLWRDCRRDLQEAKQIYPAIDWRSEEFVLSELKEDLLQLIRNKTRLTSVDLTEFSNTLHDYQQEFNKTLEFAKETKLWPTINVEQNVRQPSQTWTEAFCSMFSHSWGSYRSSNETPALEAHEYHEAAQARVFQAGFFGPAANQSVAPASVAKAAGAVAI